MADAPTVWSEFSPLAEKTGSVNLGQGLPNWRTPDFIKEAMNSAVRADWNQYTRSFGDVALCEALAKHYAPLVNKKSIDPMTEVTICVGATEGIYAAMMGLVDEGDEVIVLEPAFDIYPAQVQMAGGITKYVPIELIDGQWKMDMNKLESLITNKTKIILLNTPHNPTGKVFTRSELEDIADILRRNPQVVAVSDEVYEKLVYDGRKHVHFSSLPGHVGPDDYYLFCRQDLLCHWLEGGLGIWGCGARQTTHDGQPVDPVPASRRLTVGPLQMCWKSLRLRTKTLATTSSS